MQSRLSFARRGCVGDGRVAAATIALLALVATRATVRAEPSTAEVKPGIGVSAEPSAGCTGAATPELRADHQRIVVAADERTYVVDAPASSANDPRPVVLAFHGFQGDGASQRIGTGMASLADRERAIVVHPDGHDDVRLLGTVGRGWDLGTSQTRDLDFVRALLDRLERERCVDRRRVYATGFSNGAFFASLLGCRLGDRIAAIAPIAGGMPLPACTPARPVAVLMMYGRADDVVPPDLMRGARDWWVRVDHCGASQDHDGCATYAACAADVVACEGTQMHLWPAGATERIWRFFAAHPRT